MRVSSAAAEAANSNGHQPNSPALEQLRAAIEPDATNADSSATAVLEAGEDEPEEPGPAGPSPSELFDFDACHSDEKEEGAEETLEQFAEAQVEKAQDATAIPPQAEYHEDSLCGSCGKRLESHRDAICEQCAPEPRPAPVTAPAPYDPIAEVEEEIKEIGERIVKHSCKIAELDAALKAEKKSWKTASDELVKLHGRKAELLLDQREKEKREQTKQFAEKLVRNRYTEPEVTQQSATPEPTAADAPESTEAFHNRIDAAFAPTQSSTPAAPTPEQNAWDAAFRALPLESLDGITPKILDILDANGIRTVGDWQDVPTFRGIEYTQLSGAGGKMTEARFEKVMDAMLNYMKKHPRPEAVVQEMSVEEFVKLAESSPAMPTIDIDDI